MRTAYIRYTPTYMLLTAGGDGPPPVLRQHPLAPHVASQVEGNNGRRKVRRTIASIGARTGRVDHGSFTSNRTRAFGFVAPGTATPRIERSLSPDGVDSRPPLHRRPLPSVDGGGGRGDRCGGPCSSDVSVPIALYISIPTVRPSVQPSIDPPGHAQSRRNCVARYLPARPTSGDQTTAASTSTSTAVADETENESESDSYITMRCTHPPMHAWVSPHAPRDRSRLAAAVAPIDRRGQRRRAPESGWLVYMLHILNVCALLWSSDAGCSTRTALGAGTALSRAWSSARSIVLPVGWETSCCGMYLSGVR